MAVATAPATIRGSAAPENNNSNGNGTTGDDLLVAVTAALARQQLIEGAATSGSSSRCRAATSAAAAQHHHPQQQRARGGDAPPPAVVRARVAGRLRAARLQAWAAARGREVPPPRLRPAVRAAVARWFALVDDDGSGTLERHELAAALRAARIPADARSITEMIALMDTDRDGVIGWREFQSFMERGFAAGKRLLSGEFVLPSGVALPLGAMIAALARARMVADVAAGGAAREKWARFSGDPSADAAALARAEREVQSRQLWREEDDVEGEGGHAAGGDGWQAGSSGGGVGGSGSGSSSGGTAAGGSAAALAEAVRRAAAARWPNGAPPVPRLRLETLRALATAAVVPPSPAAAAPGATPRIAAITGHRHQAAWPSPSPRALLGNGAGALLPASPRYLHARPSARKAPPRALLMLPPAPLSAGDAGLSCRSSARGRRR